MSNRREILASISSLPFWHMALTSGTDMKTSEWTDRAVMWRRVLDDRSFELATITRSAKAYRIHGTALIAEGAAPSRVNYIVECDARWHTRRVRIRQALGDGAIDLELTADHGKWRRNGVLAPNLDGCSDVDLGISPSTNALPINRLQMPVGEKQEIRAAWVRFPQCTVEPAQQSYERLAPARYRYRSVASGFTAVIDVDDAGLPLDYSGIWSRVATTNGADAAHALEQPDPGAEGFSGALVSSCPAAELGGAADTFAWLIGGWTADVKDFDKDGTVRTGTGEWWFSWVLEGRAIQDVWIVPPRGLRGKQPQTANNRYGSTIRYFDRVADLWRMVWVNPVSGALNTLQGRRSGDRIALEGAGIRWSFEDIESDSFVWRGEEKTAAGTWRVSAEFRLQRIA